MTVVVLVDCSEMELGLAVVASGSSGSTLALTWLFAKMWFGDGENQEEKGGEAEMRTI